MLDRPQPPSESPIIKCPLCKTLYSGVHRFARHLWRKHAEAAQRNRCLLCNGWVFSEDDFALHCNTHHSPEDMLMALHSHLLSVRPEKPK